VAGKAIAMFQRMNIRLLGVIENMSSFICPHCGGESDIFGSEGGHKLSERFSLPFLGAIPLDIRMRQGGDVGQPVMLQFPDSELAAQFRAVAENLAKEAASQPQPAATS
jgi:ATP-binding protein involved in chromosome partitioning